MAITKDNFIVIYELGNSDSLEFATYYAGKHGMDVFSSNTSANIGDTGGISWEVNGQLLGIQLTDNSEILESEDVFNTQLLNPILDAITNAEELKDMSIWGIVLGYDIPGGFRHGNDIVSSTSRLSRLNFSFSKKTQNKLYNRSIFQRFDSTDASYALICSRIDAPTLKKAKAYLDNAEKVNDQSLVNGTFYFDPYSDRATIGTSEYQDILTDFGEGVLPLLNLNTWTTTFMDPYIDSIIPFVEQDSFVWSWFTDRSHSTFFQDSNAIRVFFYNADYDGGYSIRETDGRSWPFLSMEARYATSAGAMSDPTIQGFLNPISFFNALLRGASIGEAFLFSLPYLSWTISLFGDPLVYCSFPASETVSEVLINKHETWNIMSKDLARTAANLFKKERELKDVVLEIVDITTEDSNDVSVLLLYPANDLYINNNRTAWTSQLKPLVDTLFDFPRLGYYYQTTKTLAPNINEYLFEQGFRVSRLLSKITGEAIIEDDNLLDTGWWQFEFIVNDDDLNNYIDYHFKMEVATDEDFTNIIISKDSYTIRNWTYEKEKDVFVTMTFSGVSSSYIGRKIRYESRRDSAIGLDEYLNRGKTYYFRIVQYNLETLDEYSPREFSDIIYT